jgi:polyferredoxin
MLTDTMKNPTPVPEPARKAEPAQTGSARHRRRRHRIESLRTAVQLVSLAVIIWIGVEFVIWYGGLQSGASTVGRPPGAEGFLPISALISLRYWFETGVANRVHPAGFVLLVLIIAMGWLLKKSFCSWICPVGTISESLAAVGRKIFRRRLHLPRWLDYPLRSIKYLLLFFFAWAVFVQMTPKAIELFVFSPYNKVADLKMMLFFTEMSSFSLKVLVGLVLLSLVIPYFWCRYLCPYGALLGVISLASPLKITRHASSCIDCNLCNQACPALLPVDRLKRVSSDECVGCLSCVAACPVPEALAVETPPFCRRTVRPAVFAALVVVLFFGGIQAAKLAGYWQNDITDAEYQKRAAEINSPKYHHAQGEVPAYTPED